MKSRADYEDGKGAEAKIDNVVLYFYDTDGSALNVNVGATNTNYKIFKGEDLTITKDAEPIKGTTNEYNVENWFTQTVELTLASAKTEAQVLVMVNANVSANGKYVLNGIGNAISNVSLTQLRDNAIFKGHYVDDNSLFVMGSSAYYEDIASNKKHISDNIKLFTKKEDAEKTENQVQLYVERVKARVEVIEKAGTTGHLFTPTIEAADLPELPEDVKKEDLRIKVIGWDLNTTPDLTYFFKELSVPDGWTGAVNWNESSLHRSFWEVIPSGNNQAFITQFVPNNITTEPVTANKKYTNSNTSTTPTKVLVFTQLLDKNNNAVSIASWYGNNYLCDDNCSALKVAIAEYFKDGSYYVKTEVAAEDETSDEEKNQGYRLINDKEIILTQGTGSTDASGKKRESWMVYVSLKDDIQYYKGTVSGQGGQGMTFTEAKYDDVVKTLKINEIQGAKVWKDGYAYYFVDIKHLGGKTGVVRNHAYTIEIDGFVGLGTPIYDPTIVIPNPETPDDTDNKSYVSVKMNVLSWRIVPVQNVTFGKK